MKRIIVSIILCFIALYGCSNQEQKDETLNDNKQSTSEIDPSEKNLFYPSPLTEKDQFYLSSSDNSLIPFEVSFDKNYSTLTCKLYELKDGNWNNLEQFDLELSGDTFWFLVSNYLINAEIQYKNVNPEPSAMAIQGGKSFNEVTPSFGSHGIMMYTNITKETKVKSNEEFPVVANIVYKGMDSRIVDTDIFYHPEKNDVKEEETYYILTFTFNE